MKKSYKAAGKTKKGADGTVRRVRAPRPRAAAPPEAVREVLRPDPTSLMPSPSRPKPSDAVSGPVAASLKAAADPAEVDKLLSVTEEELEEVRKAGSPTLSPEEKVAIIEMRGKEMPIAAIAARLQRSANTVSAFLTSIRSTTALAQLHLRANALVLAERIVTHADIDQSLEVMDRLDVLNKKMKDAGAANTQFNIIVGMPGSPQAASPVIQVPSQKDLEGG